MLTCVAVNKQISNLLYYIERNKPNLEKYFCYFFRFFLFALQLQVSPNDEHMGVSVCVCACVFKNMLKTQVVHNIEEKTHTRECICAHFCRVWCQFKLLLCEFSAQNYSRAHTQTHAQ